MVELTFGDDPIFETCTMELDRGGKSYTIDTVRQLTGIFPPPEFAIYLIVGADTLAGIPNWKEPDEIFRLVTVASMVRAGTVLPKLPLDWALEVVQLDTPLIDIASSDVRQRVASGQSIEGLVAPDVAQLIKSKSLYIVQESTSFS
jgi:nicotinate-nucleotide adenylyltransferase